MSLPPETDTSRRHQSLGTRRPYVIGHRGAPGYAPEHTARSYQRALAAGVDFIEPDLVPTSDGHLLCRHENDLALTTDIASMADAPPPRLHRSPGAQDRRGWFSEDLTLDDLAGVRARERFAEIRPGNLLYADDRLLTLDDTIRMIAGHNLGTGERVGLCLELKHANHFASRGLPLDELLADTLHRNRHLLDTIPIYVEAADPFVLKRIARHLSLPVLQLIEQTGTTVDPSTGAPDRTHDELCSASGLIEVAHYATGIAVNKDRLVNPSTASTRRTPTGLTQQAQSLGLEVFAWTFRSENAHLPTEYRAGLAHEIGLAGLEYQEFFDLGVDAVFSDHPDTAVAERDRWLAGRHEPVAPQRPTRTPAGRR